MFWDEVNCVGANDGAIALRQSTEFVVKGTLPYGNIVASQEGIDGFLDAVFVVDMVDMMLKGCDGLCVLQ
jgi:hypothetical protein